MFISFEGSEGCGKSTQISRLAQRLRDSGAEVIETREPGGTAIGEKIRELLQHAAEGESMTPETEILLFAASRAQIVRELIAPSLERGAWVLADRFLDSTTVYQGMARPLDRESVEFINRFAVGQWMPDLTILLDMDEAVAMERLESRGDGKKDRMESEPMEFFRKVREGYLALARENPQRISIVDAALSADEVEKAILQIPALSKNLTR
ncbi:MAG: dTMP kinase [Verrucomicrobiota bacterium]